MLLKLKLLVALLTLITCMDVVYGKNINDVWDLLDKSISAKDKLEYLNTMYNDNNYSFSEEDIDALALVFSANDIERDFLDTQDELNELFGENDLVDEVVTDIEELSNIFFEDQDNKEINEQDIEIMKNIRATILRIFLRSDINEDILTSSQITNIAILVIDGLRFSSILSREIRFLSLKVLVKMNELKTNSDDELSTFGRNMVKTLLPDDTSLTEIVDRMNTLHEKENFWDKRSLVEDYIFDPILRKYDRLCVKEDRKNNYYRTENIEALEEYEKYLLDRLKFFPIDNHLKQLVEEAFFNTQFVKFRPQYIDAMFSLDMRTTLLKIILDTSIDTDLRVQAIEVSLKLLSQVDVLYFKNFSTNLLRILSDISSSSNEKAGFKKVVQEKIKLLQEAIATHDEIKDLEYIIFSPDISVIKKLWYLNDYMLRISSFSKKDLGFVKKVLDAKNLSLSVKARVATLVIFRSDKADLSEVLTPDDLTALWFLWERVDNRGVEVKDKIFSDPMFFMLWTMKNLFVLSDEQVIQQAGKFGMLSLLLDYVEGNIEEVDESIRKLAIRTSLDFLFENENFKVSGDTFLESLQKIADNPKESVELRNLVDFILLKARSKGGFLALQNCYCTLFFSF